jgi:hypothetical protein
MVLWSGRYDVYERIREYLESTTHKDSTLRHTHPASGLPTPDRRRAVEHRYMVTAYLGKTVVKRMTTPSANTAFEYARAWLGDGYVVRVEQ